MEIFPPDGLLSIDKVRHATHIQKTHIFQFAQKTYWEIGFDNVILDLLGIK